MRTECIAVIVIIGTMSSFSFATSTRFAGMGNLSFLFQGDYQRLDLYDFAGISAGFLRNDSVSFYGLRGAALREEWEQDSAVYWVFGQALPPRLLNYASVGAVGFYDFLPHIRLAPNEFFYESRRLEPDYGAFGRGQSPQAWGLYAGYSRMTLIFQGDTHSVSVPALDIIYAKSFSEKSSFGITLDAFYGSYNHEDQYTASLFPPGGGFALGYESNSLDLGINAEYHHPIFSIEIPFGEASYGGHAVSPSLGSVVKAKDIRWATVLHYRWMDLGGSSAGYDLGNVEFNAYTAKTQILFTPANFHFAVFGQYDNSEPAYINQSDSAEVDLAYRDYIIGGGAGIEFPNILAGIEAIYLSNRLEERVIEDTIESTSLNFKVGTEFGLISNLMGRAGYGYNEVDLSYEDSVYTLTTNTITGGLGIYLSPRTRIDLAYNYKWTTVDLLPDEKITDHIVSLYFKYLMDVEGY